MRIILTFLLLASVCSAEIIPADRRTTWEGNVGIPGGIPDSSAMTVYTTLAAGASLATVQAAINACPAGQVVQLSAGAYSFADYLNIDRSNCVLRGAGVDSTVITLADNGAELRIRGVAYSAASDAALSVDADLSVDATLGGITLTLASVPAWVTVGELIGIDQLDDAAFVSATGTEQGGNSYRELEGNGTRGLGQINRVTAKTATTITLDSPLLYGFQTAKTAQIFQPGYDPGVYDSAKNCGVEDLTIRSVMTGGSAMMMRLEKTDNCWVKNVEIDNMTGAYAIWLVFAYRCQFAQLYIHDSHLYGGGQAYGVAPWHLSTRNLIEDSIFLRMHNAMTCNYGASGNVFAYNYELEGMSDAGQNPGMNTHGIHAFKNLWEGNYCEDKVLGDWTHGSASHNTVFRNRITGENGITDSRTCVSIEYYNRYWNIVGNILGTDGLQNKYLQHSGSTAEGTEGSIVKVGGVVNINSDFTTSDAASYTSGSFIMLHGNYDTVTDGQTWEATIADHVIPDSLYLSAKPAFFGDLTWPPFDPATPGTGVVTRIPAGNRDIPDRTSSADSIAVAIALTAATLHVGDFSSPSTVTQDFNGYTAGADLSTLSGWTVTDGAFVITSGGMALGNSFGHPDIAAYQPTGFKASVNYQVEATLGTVSGGISSVAAGAAIAIQPDGSCYFIHADGDGDIYFGYVSSFGLIPDVDVLSDHIFPLTYEGLRVRLTVSGSGATRVCTAQYNNGAGWVTPSGWGNRDFGPNKRLDGGKGGISAFTVSAQEAVTSLTITNQ